VGVLGWGRGKSLRVGEMPGKSATPEVKWLWLLCVFACISRCCRQIVAAAAAEAIVSEAQQMYLYR